MTVGKTPWRELNLEDIALWDAAPRRLVLALFSGLVILCTTVYWLVPQYDAIAQRRELSAQLQSQFATQANLWAGAQKNQGEQEQAAQAIQALQKSQLTNWLAEIASDAENMGLTQIKISPQVVDEAQSAQAGAQTDALAAISGRVLLQANGDFASLSKWWAALSASNHVLSMEQIEINGVGGNKVHGQVWLVFAQKAQP